MKAGHLSCALAALVLQAGRLEARPATDIDYGSYDDGSAQDFLQCVPYARQLTGIQIYGDAHTWWDQAEGRYARGHRPKVGAVMSFRPYGSSRLGHVAAVSRIINSRTVLISHANWAPINGRRGQIENNVRAVDVSPNNDWSEVRVWFAPINGLGTTHWPLNGFIYNEPPSGRGRDETRLAARGDRRPLRLAARSETYGDDPIGDIIARRLR